ncbi:hypothetical protein SAMN04488082_12232 [Desulfomicrobium apsheronum]|uniref:Uncharacterized protein n=2 Tax=Desulfomicrobium apsheronum TaxID=52560 RepID=A0A1I3Z3Q6_9BACT|nr:hypothetical protein SAMN04488082_12232 [Desulfomicrobium apsheronum]
MLKSIKRIMPFKTATHDSRDFNMKYILIACAFFCAILSGCATNTLQRNALENFGLATERVGRMSESEFLSMRDEIIEMNSLLMILDNSKNAESRVYDEPALAETTAMRVAACKSLRMYGDLLMRLAADDRTGMVRKSARVFLDNITETLGPDLTLAQEEAVQNVALGLDARWTAQKKSETIQDVVLAFADALTILAGRLLADFSLDEPSTSHLKAYADTARELKTLSSDIIDAGDAEPLSKRNKAVKAFVLAQKALVRAEAMGARIHEAMTTLQKANAHVAAAIQDNSYDLREIREYGKQIQKISTMQQVLSR